MAEKAKAPKRRAAKKRSEPTLADQISQAVAVGMEQAFTSLLPKLSEKPPPPEEPPYEPPPKPPERRADPNIIEDIMAGPPAAEGSDTPDYTGTPGEAIPMVANNNQARGAAPMSDEPNLNNLSNIRSQLFQLGERQFAAETLIRQFAQQLTEMTIRLQQAEAARTGPKAGMRIN